MKWHLREGDKTCNTDGGLVHYIICSATLNSGTMCESVNLCNNPRLIDI